MLFFGRACHNVERFKTFDWRQISTPLELVQLLDKMLIITLFLIKSMASKKGNYYMS